MLTTEHALQMEFKLIIETMAMDQLVNSHDCSFHTVAIVTANIVFVVVVVVVYQVKLSGKRSLHNFMTLHSTIG